MTPRQYWEAHTEKEVRATCRKAKTNYANFRLIALYDGSVSARLAERLAKASGGEMTEIEILYSERYEKKQKRTQKNAA